MPKIIELSDLKIRLASLRSQGKKIVFTNGCFDLLHVGHVRYLAAAKALGDVLVVGLNDDESMKLQKKGPGRPLVSQSERAEILASLACVDYVTLFSEPSVETLIHAIEPEILTKGGDWPKNEIVGREFIESRGGRVVSVPLEKGYSTSALIEKIKNI